MNSNLGLNKSQFEQIDKRLENITSTKVEEIEIEMNNPPAIEQLSDSNKSYSINCSILFIDIRKSTDLSDKSHAKSMVKIYRSFMRMAVDCVRKNLGVTRQFLGDRIMGVFMDDKDENGNVITLGVDKAVYCARTMQTVLDYSLNKHINNNINNKTIECGIGISCGKVLVTQVGMRGIENNEEKENEKDVVWVGKITNYASKYSDLANGGEIFISKDVYKNISMELKDKEAWSFSTRSKSNRVYEGYVSKNFYLDNKDEFGKVFSQAIEIENNQSENNLSEGILKVEGLIDKLLRKENELSKKEAMLKNKESQLKQIQIGIDEENSLLIKEKKKLKMQNELLYLNYRKIFSDTFCKYSIIKELGADFWMKKINDMFEIGKELGKSELRIKIDLVVYLIDIYYLFKDYYKAYEYLIIMAEYSSWLSYEYKNIIPKVKTSWKLKETLEKRISTMKDEKIREEFENHYKEISKIYWS
ncbi:adenylate/guanylate cyclase domain-containing protein [Clostridium perfringens]|uniref:adenylate/guanylate cyclase domain-containing protein n=1 Tax=Clostridium perfringens TaxID=1502 RepID=UPI001F31640A|nr:adenylate/guanylate cyclase domain-containing protein [Clostridium perfringens]MDK0574170.1 adenylate/guanylate cyclase domain-containing protein [Clostridium perfringens]MDM0537759.1 adenylate/guanylate cyclase domain-containing protein [Clostridium perfringens]UBL01216.1 adenylate/guanylate cyclase domain-containing protein [Clostridium perfringens]